MCITRYSYLLSVGSYTLESYRSLKSLHHSKCLDRLVTTDIIKSRWMTLTYNCIKDRHLADLAVPGTHNSATWAIHSHNTTLVDSQLALLYHWSPDTILNWSIAQTHDLHQQLHWGFRYLDLRVAYVTGPQGLNFYWWHCLTADLIEPGLRQISDFVNQNPGEVIILSFTHIVEKGLLGPVSLGRDESLALSAILLKHLQSKLVQRTEVQTNPTISEILSTGKNILAFVDNTYMIEQHASFWPRERIRSAWIAASNPESLFTQRSDTLKYFKSSGDSLTEISGAINLDYQSIVISPRSHSRSFEGVFPDLISLARRGTNTAGMRARDSSQYSSGKSVHYRGVNDMYKHWLARPLTYKPNIIYVDDGVNSSDIVTTAILANLKLINRQVTLTFQGSGTNGFYKWFMGTAYGQTGRVFCDAIITRFVILSKSANIERIVTSAEVTIEENQYPADAKVHVQVSLPSSSTWFHIYSNDIITLINNQLDLYIRGNQFSKHKHICGFAYISRSYNLFSRDCKTPPSTGYDNLLMLPCL